MYLAWIRIAKDFATYNYLSAIHCLQVGHGVSTCASLDMASSYIRMYVHVFTGSNSCMSCPHIVPTSDISCNIIILHVILSQEGLSSFEILNLTLCFTPDGSAYIIFNLLLFVYLIILVLISFYLILNNKRIYSHFRDDVVHSFRALFLAIFPLLFQCAGVFIFTEVTYIFFWSMSVIAFVVFNIIAQLAMFSPMVSLI